MKTYRVTYEIDLDAESPSEAAEIAWRWMRDENSLPPAFNVVELTADGNAVAPVESVDFLKEKSTGRQSTDH